MSYTLYSSLLRSSANGCCGVGHNYDEVTLGCYTSKVEALFLRYEMEYEMNYVSLDDPEIEELTYDTETPIPQEFIRTLNNLVSYARYAYLLDLRTNNTFHPMWLRELVPDLIEASEYDIVEIEDMLLIRIDELYEYKDARTDIYDKLQAMYSWYIPSSLRAGKLDGLPRLDGSVSLEEATDITPLLFDKTNVMELLMDIVAEEEIVLKFSSDELFQYDLCKKYNVLSYFNNSFLLSINSYRELVRLQQDVYSILSNHTRPKEIPIELEYDVVEQAEFAANDLKGVSHIYLRQMRPYRVIGLLELDRVAELPDIISSLKKK